MNKYTPGPWELIHWNKRKPDERTIVADSIEDHLFSFDIMPENYPLIRQRQLADLKLMAAAPEMLEAAELLINFYDQVRPKIKLIKGYSDPTAFIENLDKYIVKSRNAINKVKG
jgi:hypothetical protein